MTTRQGSLPSHQLDRDWPIYGHHWAVQLLKPATLPGAEVGPAHAYLFLGPRQLGKTTLAKCFAQSLLCTADLQVASEPTSRPCGRCRSCRLITNGHHPDFRLVQPTNKAKEADRADGILRVEQSSAIIHETLLSPVESRYKIFLIQDMQTANDSFANKLLKTLEEPPAHAIFCLTATDRNSLLPTIVSRCQLLMLRPTDPQTIEQGLMAGWQVSQEKAQLLARLSNGRFGWAIQQLDDPKSEEKRSEALQTLQWLVSANRIERLAFAEKLAKNRDNQKLFGLLEFWTTWWRDILLAQSNCLEACSNLDQQGEISNQAKKISQKAVQRYLRTLARIEGYLRHTTNTRLAVDVLLLQMPYLKT